MDPKTVTTILKASQDAFNQRERAETYRRRALALLEQAGGVRYEMRQKLEAAEMNYQVLQGETERLRAELDKVLKHGAALEVELEKHDPNNRLLEGGE